MTVPSSTLFTGNQDRSVHFIGGRFTLDVIDAGAGATESLYTCDVFRRRALYGVEECSFASRSCSSISLCLSLGVSFIRLLKSLHTGRLRIQLGY